MMETKPDTDISNETPAAPAVAPSVGATLRAAREEQGMKVADVAERIKFSVRQIEALEADDLPHLPEGAFLRGFIRSYARALHLDESALLPVAPVKAEVPLDVAASQAGGQAFPTFESSRQKSIYLLVGALAVALVLVVFIWSHDDAPLPDTTVIEEVQLPALSAASAPASAVSVAASAVQPADAPAAPPVPVAVVEPKKTVPPLKPKTVEPVAVTPPTAESGTDASAAQLLARLKKRPIHIVFVEESWMEITDKNGELLLSLTGTAGTEKWIGGRYREPYQVSIGRPGAVRIYNRGREVDLSQYEPLELVHLVLE